MYDLLAKVTEDGTAWGYLLRDELGKKILVEKDKISSYPLNDYKVTKDLKVIGDEVPILKKEYLRTMYHGSRFGLKGDILPKSSKYCDFGRGFYLSDNLGYVQRHLKGFEDTAKIYEVLLYTEKFNTVTFSDSVYGVECENDFIHRNRFDSSYSSRKVVYERLDRIWSDICDNRVDAVYGFIVDDSEIGLSWFDIKDYIGLKFKDLLYCLEYMQVGHQLVLKTKNACNSIIDIKEINPVIKSDTKDLVPLCKKIFGYNDSGLYYNSSASVLSGDVCSELYKALRLKTQHSCELLFHAVFRCGYDLNDFCDKLFSTENGLRYLNNLDSMWYLLDILTREFSFSKKYGKYYPDYEDTGKFYSYLLIDNTIKREDIYSFASYKLLKSVYSKYLKKLSIDKWKDKLKEVHSLESIS